MRARLNYPIFFRQLGTVRPERSVFSWRWGRLAIATGRAAIAAVVGAARTTTPARTTRAAIAQFGKLLTLFVCQNLGEARIDVGLQFFELSTLPPSQLQFIL
jgi:hypothetical protein